MLSNITNSTVKTLIRRGFSCFQYRECAFALIFQLFRYLSFSYKYTYVVTKGRVKLMRFLVYS